MIDPKDDDVADEMKELAERLSDEAWNLIQYSPRTLYAVAVGLSKALGQYVAILNTQGAMYSCISRLKEVEPLPISTTRSNEDPPHPPTPCVSQQVRRHAGHLR